MEKEVSEGLVVYADGRFQPAGKKEISGGLVVCADGRLQPTGKLEDCPELKQPGTTVAVHAVPLPAVPGYLAEVVFVDPPGSYRGPSFSCRLPEQFDRFRDPSD